MHCFALVIMVIRLVIYLTTALFISIFLQSFANFEFSKGKSDDGVFHLKDVKLNVLTGHINWDWFSFTAQEQMYAEHGKHPREALFYAVIMLS